MKYRTKMVYAEAMRVPSLLVDIKEEDFIDKAKAIDEFFNWLGREQIKYTQSTLVETRTAGTVRPGDWLLKTRNGDLIAMPDMEFTANFEVDDGIPVSNTG